MKVTAESLKVGDRVKIYEFTGRVVRVLRGVKQLEVSWDQWEKENPLAYEFEYWNNTLNRGNEVTLVLNGIERIKLRHNL